MYQQLIPIIAPVLICAGFGFAWARLGLPFEREFVTRMIMNIGTPCLILRGMAGLEVEPESFLRVVGIAVVILSATAVIGGVVLRIAKQPLRSFLPSAVFGNAGNLGLPLCLFAFGEPGLVLGVAFYLVGSVTQFIFGPLFQGREAAWRILVTTPIIYAALFGLALLATDTAMPLWLANTVDLFAGLAIPLMLLALGYSLANFRVRRAGLATGLAVLRLGLGFGLGLAAVTLLDLEGTLRGVVLIQSSMPVAVFCFLLAARYDRDPDDVAASILVSTVAAFLLLPALLIFALGG